MLTQGDHASGFGGGVRGYSAQQWELPYDLDPSRRRLSGSFHLTGKPFSGTGDMNKEQEKVTYYWDEPKVKDPGADYKPGKFKHLDEAIRNGKKK